MKKLLFILGCSVAGLSFGSQHSFVGTMCENGTDRCEDLQIIIHAGDYQSDYNMASKPGNNGKGMARFLQVVASTTGDGVGAVRDAMGGIRSTVLASGYDQFEGKLSGKSGTVTVKYNFKTGAWSVSSKGGAPKKGEILQPPGGQQ